MINRRIMVSGAMASFGAIAFNVSNTFAGSVTHEVRIKGFKFVPEKINVRVGDKITFINDDIVPHTATANDESWTTKDLQKGESDTIEVTSNLFEGYYCIYHPNMKANIEIE